MKKSLWRLAAAGLGASVALAMSAGTAGATSAHEPSRWSGPSHPTVQQLGRQESSTTQHATSEAKSTQLAPANVNAPVQLLSLGFGGKGHSGKGGSGKGGSDVDQSNHSQAESKAKNTAHTVQVMDQDQKVHAAPEPVRHGGSGGKHHRHDRDCEHGKPGHGKPGHGKPGHGKPGHGKPEHGKPEHGKPEHGKPEHGKPEHGKHEPKQAGAVQSGEQKARTGQTADSKAKSTQVLPTNVNAPIQVLSVGSNGGDTEQSNRSKAESEATNTASTKQLMQQAQQVRGGSEHGKSGPGKHGPSQGGAVQSGAQDATTDQDASSEATSTQVLPVNVNAPIQVLSVGSNGGDVEQSNRSAAESEATNTATTKQGLEQDQRVTGGSGHGSGGAVQSGEQEAATEQDADSSATSTQVLPVNVNVPVQVLSLGSNGGDTNQSNSSSAASSASNSASTVQGLGQSQLVHLG